MWFLSCTYPWWLSGKESTCHAGDFSPIPELGRFLEERKGNPLQYSFLENPMDRGAWWAAVHGVTNNLTWLSDGATTRLTLGKSMCYFQSSYHFSWWKQGVLSVPSVISGQIFYRLKKLTIFVNSVFNLLRALITLNQVEHLIFEKKLISWYFFQ